MFGESNSMDGSRKVLFQNAKPLTDVYAGLFANFGQRTAKHHPWRTCCAKRASYTSESSNNSLSFVGLRPRRWRTSELPARSPLGRFSRPRSAKLCGDLPMD